MAVRILKEFQWTKEFDDELDKNLDELSKEYDIKTKRIKDKYAAKRKELYDKTFDEYKDKNFEIVNLKSGRGEEVYIIDKVTGKLALNRISKYLKEMGFHVSHSYLDDKNEIIKVVKKSINKKYKEDEITETHNAKITSHKYVTMSLTQFSDTSKYKPGEYRCAVDITIFVRSGLKELSESRYYNNSQNNTELFEFLITSNIKNYPKNSRPKELDEIYNNIIEMIHKSVIQTGTEKYWDLKEIENKVESGDVVPVTNKESK